jgi:hypothetical protein
MAFGVKLRFCFDDRADCARQCQHTFYFIRKNTLENFPLFSLLFTSHIAPAVAPNEGALDVEGRPNPVLSGCGRVDATSVIC